MKTENCCTGCNRPDLPWAGRGTELPIAGCRFTLYPMSDKYIEIILGALKKTDTSFRRSTAASCPMWQTLYRPCS